MMIVTSNNIIILGSGRSGTSAVAGSIITGNGPKYNTGGPTHKADKFNAKGYFESNAINNINNGILWSCPHVKTTEGLKQGWLSVLDKNHIISDVSHDIEDRIERVIKEQPVCLKDPRFSYTLPVWLRYLTNLKIICVFRHPKLAIQSIMYHCQNAEYLKGKIKIDLDFCQKIWVSIYEYILNNYKTLDVLYINYANFVVGKGEQKLSHFIGHKINVNFRDEKLVHFGHKNLDFEINNKLTEIYLKLCELEYNEPCYRANYSPEKI